ncbi:MAG: glycosyltransferase family 4 protein [Candidatus Limnocylindrales bacterium]
MTATSPRRPVCMIVHAYYEEDPRVRREAEALVAAGWEVDVFGLRRPGETAAAVVEGVNLRRLPVRRHQGAGLSVYLVEYGAFLMRALWAATRAHRFRRYGLVEVHSLPDYLVFSALPMKLAGVPVLLDLHEAMPEFFRSRFPRAANPISYRLLRLQERLSIALANEVLTVNEPLAERLTRLGTSPERLTVILNSPDLRLFDPAAHPRRRFMADGKLRIVYAGALTPTYELDVVLRAVASLARRRPSLRVDATFYGRGDAQAHLEALAAELGIADRVGFPGHIPIEDVPRAVAAADIGVAPTRLDPFTQMSLSTKILEYAAMAKPVVASRLPTVERYFPADTLAIYEPGDHESLASTIPGLVDSPAERRARVGRTGRRVEELSWARQAEAYLGVVGRMVAGPDRRTQDRNGRP